LFFAATPSAWPDNAAFAAKFTVWTTLIEAETAVRPPRGREQSPFTLPHVLLSSLISPCCDYLTIATLAKLSPGRLGGLTLARALPQAQRVSCAPLLDYTRSTSVSRQPSCLHHSTSPRSTLLTQQTTSIMASSDDDKPLMKPNNGGRSLSPHPAQAARPT
jgi:hypothetical protein